MVVRLGGVEVSREAAFRLDAAKEARLSAYLREARSAGPACEGYPGRTTGCVDIEVSLDGGPAARGGARIRTSAAEYVRENADYRV